MISFPSNPMVRRTPTFRGWRLARTGLVLALALATEGATGRALAAEGGMTNWVDQLLSNTLLWSTNRPGIEVIGTKGTVERRGVGSSSEFKIGKGQALKPGERLSTRAYSQAALIHPGQVSGFDQLGRLEVLASGLKAIEGKLFIKSLGSPSSPVWVETPLGQIRPYGTELFITIDPGSQRTEVTAAAGRAELSAGPNGLITVLPRQTGVIQAGQPARVEAESVSFNRRIQSLLLYPVALDLADLGAVPGGPALIAEPALAGSLAAYRRGNVLEAFASYPTGRLPNSDAERLYLAAIGLAVGRVDELDQLLAPLRGPDRSGAAALSSDRLAGALARVVQAVRLEPAPPTSPPQTATEWMAESLALYWHSAFEASRAAAENVIRLSPDFGYGYGWLAELEFRFGKATRAQAALDRAVALSPENAQALALQGFVYRRQHRVEEAFLAFEQAATLEPRSGNAWVGLGLYYSCGGNTAKAVRCFQIAASLEPQRALLRSYLAKAYSAAAGNREARSQLELSARDARLRAREERERAVELDPEGSGRTAWIAPPTCLSKERGFYLGADVGVAFVQDVKAHSLVIAADCELSPADWVTFDPGARFDLMVGYRLSRSWRVELEGGLVWNPIDSFLGAEAGESYTHVGADKTVEVQAGHPELYQIPLLANAVYRVPIRGHFSAELGVGLGLVIGALDLDGTSIECYDDADYTEARWGRATDVVFAYQGVARIKYALTDHLALGLAYKLLGTTDHSWQEGPSELDTDPTMTHSILGELTYVF